MKKLHILLLLLSCSAAATDKNALYHQCLLTYAPKAKLPQSLAQSETILSYAAP